MLNHMPIVACWRVQTKASASCPTQLGNKMTKLDKPGAMENIGLDRKFLIQSQSSPDSREILLPRMNDVFGRKYTIRHLNQPIGQPHLPSLVLLLEIIAIRRSILSRRMICVWVAIARIKLKLKSADTASAPYLTGPIL